MAVEDNADEEPFGVLGADVAVLDPGQQHGGRPGAIVDGAAVGGDGFGGGGVQRAGGQDDAEGRPRADSPAVSMAA